MFDCPYAWLVGRDQGPCSLHNTRGRRVPSDSIPETVGPGSAVPYQRHDANRQMRRHTTNINLAAAKPLANCHARVSRPHPQLAFSTFGRLDDVLRNLA